MKTKFCPNCKQYKPLKEWYKNNSTKDKLGWDCKSCHEKRLLKLGLRSKEYRKLQYQRNKNTYRQNIYKRKFGITLETYTELLKKQNSKCAICKAKKIGKKDAVYFAIDHDHKKKRVRGLLCTNCNIGLGHFKDDVKLLQAAIIYLLNQG